MLFIQIRFSSKSNKIFFTLRASAAMKCWEQTYWFVYTPHVSFLSKSRIRLLFQWVNAYQTYLDMNKIYADCFIHTRTIYLVLLVKQAVLGKIKIELKNIFSKLSKTIKFVAAPKYILTKTCQESSYFKEIVLIWPACKCFHQSVLSLHSCFITFVISTNDHAITCM